MTLQTRRLRNIGQVRAFVEGNESVDYEHRDRESAYGFVVEQLRQLGYRGLGKRDKVTVRRFLAKTTGLSEVQVDRLIRQWRETGSIEGRPRSAVRAPLHGDGPAGDAGPPARGHGAPGRPERRVGPVSGQHRRRGDAVRIRGRGAGHLGAVPATAVPVRRAGVPRGQRVGVHQPPYGGHAAHTKGHQVAGTEFAGRSVAQAGESGTREASQRKVLGPP